MSISYSFTEGDQFTPSSLTVVLSGGRSKQVRSDHKNWLAICECLKQDNERQLVNLINDTATPVKREKVVVLPDCNIGKVRVRNDRVYYDGLEIEDCVVDHMRKCVAQNLPLTGFVAFINKVYRNIELRVRLELFDFASRNGLTINSKGNLLAYKAVNHEYMSKHRTPDGGRIDNRPGTTVRMERSLVQADHAVGCGKGLHAGSLNYVYGYGGGSDRIVIVEIDPINVVSVPSDCSYQKLRVCEYYVVGDYNGELEKVCYDAAKPVVDTPSVVGDDFDWDSIDDDRRESKTVADMIDGDDYDVGDVVTSYQGSVNVCGAVQSSQGDYVFGTKPSHSTQAGRRYHAKRDAGGKFAPRSR